MRYTLITNVPSINSVCPHPVESVQEAIAIWRDLAQDYGITNDDRLLGDGVLLDAEHAILGQIVDGRFHKASAFSASDINAMSEAVENLLSEAEAGVDPGAAVVTPGEPTMIQMDWRDMLGVPMAQTEMAVSA